MNEINWMQQGWECPKWGAVMAPHVDCCVNCRGNKGGGTATTIGNPAAVNSEWNKWNDPDATSVSSPLNPPYVLKNCRDEWREKATLSRNKGETN